jgi:arsenate reductase
LCGFAQAYHGVIASRFEARQSYFRMKKNVLFVCVHNSARSQMAEAFLNQICGDAFDAYSAGLEPGKLNPVVVEAMREVGVDISQNQTKSVQDMMRSGKVFEYVVTVCDESSAERCPLFPGNSVRLHWGFSDPSKFEGTGEKRLSKTREVRDAIREKIMQWCEQICPADYSVV